MSQSLDESEDAPLRGAAAGAAFALILGLCFPDSVGLWPLRLVAGWPGAVGRALGSVLAGSSLGPLALAQAADFQLRVPSATARAVAAALGLVFQLCAAVFLLWLAERRCAGRLALAIAGAACALAALLPPWSLPNLAEGGAALVLGLLALAGTEGSPRTALRILAGAMAVTPLVELRGPLLSIGGPTGTVAALEAGTGLPAPAWALLAGAVFAAGAYAVVRGFTRTASR